MILLFVEIMVLSLSVAWLALREHGRYPGTWTLRPWRWPRRAWLLFGYFTDEIGMTVVGSGARNRYRDWRTR